MGTVVSIFTPTKRETDKYCPWVKYNLTMDEWYQMGADFSLAKYDAIPAAKVAMYKQNKKEGKYEVWKR